MKDVIVVGGGLAGLASALWCARAGLRVTLLERAHAAGGRARTDRLAGHAFNLGGHALYAGGHAAQALRELGVGYTGKAPPTTGLLALARGELHRLPAGLFSMLATELLTFGAKIEAARALAAIARADAGALSDVTWRTWVEGVATRPEVRDVLFAIGRLTTYANAPSRASAGATIAQIRRGSEKGVLYLDGGWQTLVDGLEVAAIEAGVSILRASPATTVARSSDAGAIAVTVAGGDTITARTAILAVGPGAARALLGDESFARGLVTARAACLDVGLSELPRPGRLFALGIDQPTYYSVHSASARLAESGATVHLMKYLDPDAAADPEGAERELEDVLDRAQPGWRERVVARRFLPSLVASSAIAVAGASRPAVDAPARAGHDGVLLAGDWIGDEGMLADTSLASARAAADRAIARAERFRARPVQPAATMAAP